MIFFLNFWVCLRFFTVKVKKNTFQIGKREYGKQQTGSLLHLISHDTKLARTSDLQRMETPSFDYLTLFGSELRQDLTCSLPCLVI